MLAGTILINGVQAQRSGFICHCQMSTLSRMSGYSGVPKRGGTERRYHCDSRLYVGMSGVTRHPAFKPATGRTDHVSVVAQFDVR